MTVTKGLYDKYSFIPFYLLYHDEKIGCLGTIPNLSLNFEDKIKMGKTWFGHFNLDIMV